MFPGEDSIKAMAYREGYLVGWKKGYLTGAFVVLCAVGIAVVVIAELGL